MPSLLKMPAAALFCLVLPAYILLFLILLDAFEVILFNPSVVPYDEVVPLLITLSLTVFAAWQLSLLHQSSKKWDGAVFMYVLVGCNLFLCAFFMLVAVEELYNRRYIADIKVIQPVFRLLTRSVSEDMIFLIFSCILLLSPAAAAAALSYGLEGKKSVSRWLGAYMLMLLFPLGVWWLQARTRSSLKTPEVRITDHFGM